MPTVINGVGTWYYGKKRIHTRKGTCAFCGNVTELESYDTTLFFVVVFVPVIPLTRQRILEQCAACRKHRVLGLRQWKEAKVTAGAEVIEKLRTEPDQRDSLLQALAFTQAFQDEPLFQQIIEPLAVERRDDAAIQAQLGATYAFFARWPKAEEAYRASLAVEDQESVRERLAWTLLKQGHPREALPFLKHILDQRKEQSVGLLYVLVNGYQAEGLHDEALALMDQRDQAFPALAPLKEYRTQRKLSTRYRDSGKKIRSAFLNEGGKTGYREGSWTARLPMWITASLLVGALGLYLGSAAWIGHARKVFLVNGTETPYTVAIAGTEHALPSHSATPVRVAEGEIEVAFRNAKPALEPVHCRIETSFWSRPFANHTFVINPDRAAAILREEASYGQFNAPAGKPPTVYFGQAFYSFAGMDYVFKEFPATIEVKGQRTVTKTRVALAPPLNPEVYITLMLQHLQGEEQVPFCERLLLLDPNRTVFLYWLSSRHPPERMLEFLKAHLDDRPLRVDWHRMYQSLMEKVHPETDLRPRYQRIVAETKGQPDAIYLLGRADPDAANADRLFRQAAAAKPPSGYAMYALGYQALNEGRFADAGRWLGKAMPLLAEKMMARQLYEDSLLANGDYPRLLTELQADAQVPGKKFTALSGIIRVHALRGEKEKARAALAQVVQRAPVAERQALQQMLERLLACSEGDAAGFLKGKAGDNDPQAFEAAFLRDQLQQAAALADQAEDNTGVFHALLYLAAVRSGAREVAVGHWRALLADLKKGDRDERRLAELLSGQKPQSASTVQRLGILPTKKRVFLAVFAQRHPDEAKEVMELARKLDYQRDAISLCLRKVR